MNKKKLLWDLFMHTGKIEYYIEYKKTGDHEIVNTNSAS